MQLIRHSAVALLQVTPYPDTDNENPFPLLKPIQRERGHSHDHESCNPDRYLDTRFHVVVTCRRCSGDKKKAGVVKHLAVLYYAGLLADEPPRTAGLPII